MRAIAQRRYGGPEVLELTDLPDPKVGPDFVLVRVRAASVNPVDWKVREGYLDASFETHFPLVNGWDVAGVVDRVGPSVVEFAPGDEVIGYVREDHVQRGTYAELVSAPVRTLARKPRNLSFPAAAALPLCGLTAYQALTRALHVTADDTVLIHAAAGGVGTFAVQIAKAHGARVIGTASERNHDYLRALGAEPIAYGDGLADGVSDLAPKGVDAVLDLIGGEALTQSVAFVKDPGRIASIIDAKTVTELGGRYVFVRPDPTDLAEITELAESGRLRVELAETFPLEKAAEAQRLIQQGHTRGKIAISVG